MSNKQGSDRSIRGKKVPNIPFIEVLREQTLCDVQSLSHLYGLGDEEPVRDQKLNIETLNEF